MSFIAKTEKSNVLWSWKYQSEQPDQPDHQSAQNGPSEGRRDMSAVHICGPANPPQPVL